MIENKVFVGGGLNQDVDENFLKPNEWTNARNIRNTDRLELSDGVISNVKGNTLVNFTLPGGTNRCIGSFSNEQTKLYYSFIFNSDGFHTITEYNPSTNVITKVLQSKTDTDGVDILKFQQYELINGVSMIGGNLMYWTDGFNPPRNIDVTKAKTGTYYTDEASISLAKEPPIKVIDCAYGNDTNKLTSSNRLKNQLFQFKYLYVYEDNSRSAWSSASEVPLPQFEVQNSVSSSTYKNNNIVLNFDAGTKFVKTIEIAAQVKGVAPTGVTQDWFSILSVDRSKIISDTKFAYDSSTNLATFTFYNDGLYESVDIREMDLPYDFVPLKAKTLEIVNGNVLVMGNNTEGYDNIAIDLEFDVTYKTQSAPRLFVSFPDFTGSNNAVFAGVPLEGDVISIDYPDPDPPFGTLFYDYPVGPDTSGSLYDTLVAYGNALSSIFYPNLTYTIQPYYDFALSGENYQLLLDGQSFSDLHVTINPAANAGTSNSAYKTNSRYQFGLVYYDEFNRSTYVQTNDSCIVATSSWGATSGESPQIHWQINNAAPTGFTTYQWVRTEQLTHKKFLYVTPGGPAPTGTVGTNYQQINISPLSSYNVTNPDSILSYDFTPGDRCSFHKAGTEWISGYDVAVVDFSPSDNILTLQRGNTVISSTGNLLLEIYTPKVRANSPQEQFFYEFGEVFSCTGGVHSVTSGTFSHGDIYTRDRAYQVSGPTTTDFYLEDPNFSDFYVSNFSSNGRTNIFAPQAKQLTLPTDIRYSDTYVPNTNINGLSRFYGDAFETYDRVNGSIQKLAVRDNYLVTLQELKSGYIPINQSIIEDQGGGVDANVAISTKLLNKIRYYAGDYGVGLHPESFARFAGTMYFADPNRGAVLRLKQGLEPISMIGMDSFFTKELSKTNTIANCKILGSYDPRNDEYMITFNYPSNTGESTVAFSEIINRWTTFYDFIPEFGNYIFNQYITYQNGQLWLHNTNDFYGSFYGIAWAASVELTFNASLYQIKSFIGVMEQTNSVWVPGDISTSRNQVSQLSAADFTEKEGVYFASYLREKTGDPSSLYFGDDLKGNWIKMNMSNTDNAKVSLLSVDMRYIPSYQGIK